MNATIPSAVTVETLTPVAYQGVPVITTDLLAAVYGASAKNISDNYAYQAARFTEGKHFFKLVGRDLRALKNKPGYSGLVGKRAPHLILWTERGAARHAKMLDTDQAWEVFERLEDAYFRPTAAPAAAPRPLGLREKRLLIAECRKVNGLRAAQAMWRDLDMPGAAPDLLALPDLPPAFKPGTGLLVQADQVVVFDLTDTDLRDGDQAVVVQDYQLRRVPFLSRVRRLVGDRPDLDGGAHLSSLPPHITSIHAAPTNTACRVLGRVIEIRKVTR